LVGLADSYAWLVLEVSGLEVPFPCSAQKGSARVHGSHGVFFPYDTFQPDGSGSPGGSTPRHLPPSGFDYPLDGFLSTGPGTWSVDQSSAHGVRPSGPCSSRPAVPFSGPPLSCRFPASACADAIATPEVISDREGERKPPSEDYDRRTLPSWVLRPFRVFSSVALGPASRSEPFLPFRPEVLPTFPLPGGAPRV